LSERSLSRGARRRTWSRREFLIRGGVAGLGLTVFASCSRWLPVLPTRALPEPDEALLWVALTPLGRVRFRCPRAEMGQGIATGLAQVIAEELAVSRERIDVEFPPTDAIAPALMTVGSMSMQVFFAPVAHAAAALRETLRARAAARSGVAPAELVHREDGFDLPGGARVTFAELVTERDAVIEAAPGGESARPYALDGARRRSAIGANWAPLGAEAIVAGRETYSRDVVVPGMLYGAVARPPRPDARLLASDEAAARAVPGVTAVVVARDRRLAAVVAESPLVLPRALQALAARFDGGERISQQELDALLDVDAALARDDFEHEPASTGDVATGAREAVARLDARYDSPMTAHAALEPRAAVAEVTPSGVTVWAATQDPWLMQGLVARELGRARDEVEVRPHRIGGAFGGRALCQAALEAAWLSQSVGRPVRVQWSREDEFRHNGVGPQFSHRIRAGLGRDGRVASFDHAMISSPIIFTSAAIPGSLQPIVDLLPDDGTARGAIPPYALANHRLRYSDVRIPIVTGAWRGLGAAPNAFAVESAMDELAGLAHADPLAFRLAHVPADRPRLRAVLERVAELSRWGTARDPGVGRGVACAIYKDVTYVAVVAEVEVDPAARSFRVRRVFCAQDCGLVVSPELVRAQIEGNVVWGCGMALHEAVRAEDGAPAQTNFDAYPLLRQSETPEVEIALLEPAGVPPSGAGEAALVPTPAAIANAIHDATGQRLRRLPLRLAG